MLPRVVFAGESQAVDIETRLAQRKIPAMSVAVIRRGKLDWSGAWGQLQNGSARVACNSLFQAGSLAKPITLFASLRMKQQGLIDFDKNIDSYLSSYQLPIGLQTEQNPVTFRNLFAHTSCITPGGYDGYAPVQVLPTDQQTVLAESPTNDKKVEVLNILNTSVRYSGGGYTVAEIVLQDQWREPFEQIMRIWLLAPLNMKQADFT